MNLHLAWATETGHSFDLAREFRDTCINEDLQIQSASVLKESTQFLPGIWIIFVSTTGQGSLPFSARKLWKQMMKKSFKISQHIKFAIYSLGDRGYGDNFAMAARKLRQRMKMLGAQQIVDIGLGDDQDPQGFRDVYSSGWKDNLVLKLKEIAKRGKTSSQVLKYEWKSLVDSECIISNVENLSNRKGRRVFWVQLEIKGTKAKQGEIVQIFPFNRAQDVTYLLNYFNKSGEEIIEYLGMTMTLKQTLFNHCNISSILNFYFFSGLNREELINSAANNLHKQKIKEFGDNFQEYFNFFWTYKRNIIQFLQDFEVKFSLEYFLQHISPVLGRKFTISRVQQDKIWLLVKLVQTKITEGRLFKGLCSHDLLNVGVKRNCKVLPGDIIPQQMRNVNIMISLGTGIAPFIWMINQLSQKNIRGLLIYTNSYSDEIFHRILCKVKTQNLEQQISYTREGGLKLLRIIQNSMQRIDKMIKKNGLQNVRVFYCGPKQLHQYLQTCFSKMLGMSTEELTKKKLIVYQNW